MAERPRASSRLDRSRPVLMTHLAPRACKSPIRTWSSRGTGGFSNSANIVPSKSVEISFIGHPASFISNPARAQVRPRSGTSLKTDIVIANAPGTIDADYPDEWCVPVRHGGTRDLVITHGERIAQMVLVRHEVLDFMIGAVRPTTDRAGGFGSTGTK